MVKTRGFTGLSDKSITQIVKISFISKEKLCEVKFNLNARSQKYPFDNTPFLRDQHPILDFLKC